MISNDKFVFEFVLKKDNFSKDLLLDKIFNNKGFSGAVQKEKTTIEKGQEVININRLISTQVLTSTLLAYPKVIGVLAIAAGASIWELSKKIFESFFTSDKDTDKKDVDTDKGEEQQSPFNITNETGLNLFDNSSIFTSLFPKFDINIPETETPEAGGEVQKNQKFDGKVDYEVSLMFSDNADDVVNNLTKIGSEDVKNSVSAPLDEWRTKFSEVSVSERSNIETNIIGPYSTLSSVLGNVITKKKEVDSMESKIKSYKSKIKHLKERKEREKREREKKRKSPHHSSTIKNNIKFGVYYRNGQGYSGMYEDVYTGQPQQSVYWVK